ncbi:hypothetical protein ACRALDRAFT_1092418 [Sodiomyces alcalophilus JCM 7366]|uniref:uncharacterized protein n=1 Tax=Sodiomyces alcalophilus JCM 7366 TaxID=591952 RepID=UPI0039B55289
MACSRGYCVETLSRNEAPLTGCAFIGQSNPISHYEPLETGTSPRSWILFSPSLPVSFCSCPYPSSSLVIDPDFMEGSGDAGNSRDDSPCYHDHATIRYFMRALVLFPGNVLPCSLVIAVPPGSGSIPIFSFCRCIQRTVMPRYYQRSESEKPHEDRHSRHPYSHQDTYSEHDYDRGRRWEIAGDPDGPSRRYRRENGPEGGRRQTRGRTRSRSRRGERDRDRKRRPRTTHARRPHHSPSPSCFSIRRSCLGHGDDTDDDDDEDLRRRRRRHPTRAKPRPTSPESRPRGRRRRPSPGQNSRHTDHCRRHNSQSCTCQPHPGPRPARPARQNRPSHDRRPPHRDSYSRSGPAARGPSANPQRRQPRSKTNASSNPTPAPETKSKSKAQKAAQYAAFGNAVRIAVQSGAQAAYKLRNHPSPWLGEKGLRVAAAAVVPGVVDGYLASRKAATPSSSGSTKKPGDKGHERLRQLAEAGIRNFVLKTGGDSAESNKRTR